MQTGGWDLTWCSRERSVLEYASREDWKTGVPYSLVTGCVPRAASVDRGVGVEAEPCGTC
jgi:hypothetical protein